MAKEKEEADARMKDAISKLPNGGVTIFQPDLVKDSAAKLKGIVKQTMQDVEIDVDKSNEHQLMLARKFEDAKLRIVAEHAEAKLKVMDGAGNLLQALQTKNKAVQKAELVAEKGLAIAEIIIQTQVANAQIRAKAAASTLPGPAYFLRLIANEAATTPVTAANNLAAGLNIAAVVAATAAGLIGFARGGKIRSGFHVNTGTKDDTLILANKTETVLTQEHVARLGGSGAMALAKVPGYAMGGYIGGKVTSVSPYMNIDYDKLAAKINDKKVTLNINEVNSAQAEIKVITQSQRI
jgi:hypothetical protein